MACHGESVRIKINRLCRQCGQIGGIGSAPADLIDGATKSGDGSGLGVAWSCNICLTRAGVLAGEFDDRRRAGSHQYAVPIALIGAQHLA
jgi:hypothetical protein